jgi:hypothetical protein
MTERKVLKLKGTVNLIKYTASLKELSIKVDFQDMHGNPSSRN